MQIVISYQGVAVACEFRAHDPIELVGGGLYQYAPNPLSWIEPLGLTACGGKNSTKDAFDD